MRLWRVNLGQRIVLIIALGAVLVVCGVWMTSAGNWNGSTLVSPFYVPNSGELVSGGSPPHPWVQAWIWFIFIAIWTVCSLYLLRGRSVRRSSGPEPIAIPTDQVS